MQMANNPPYKHAIAAYGAAMVAIPLQIGYGGCQKFLHGFLPWRCHDRHLTLSEVVMS
jgi:hypothetical protein